MSDRGERREALRALLARVDDAPSPARYVAAARQVAPLLPDVPPTRVLILSTFTADGLLPYLVVEGARRELVMEPRVGLFNAIHQQLVGDSPAMSAQDAQFVFVMPLLQDLCPELVNGFASLSAAEIDERVNRVVDDLVTPIEVFRRRSTATVLLHNFTLPPAAEGLFDSLTTRSRPAVVREINARLAAAARQIRGCYIVECDRLAADIGLSRWIDDKMWLLARAPLGSEALRALAVAQTRMIASIARGPRKCLVLDLDNTLWGGVLGEVGIGGIAIGQTYPGNAFLRFQQLLLDLSHRGLLLAINSKNNEADVDEVWRSHPDMLLRREHFAAIRINWRGKPDNMMEIAEELSIGVDSLAFFDDSSFERGLMHEALPEVLTIAVPDSPLGYVRALLDSGICDRRSDGQDEAARTGMYQAQVSRQAARQAAGSLADYLRDLQMVAQIQPVDDISFRRAVDLLQKTNQFNLTTRRHSDAALARMLADPSTTAFLVRVSDRFGDNGLVGLAIVQAEGGVARLESFLLSCRVIGRGVETALLAHAAAWARERGCSILAGEFIPTAKNAPAADFFRAHGFTPTPGPDQAGAQWRIDTDAATLSWPDHITRAGAPFLASV